MIDFPIYVNQVAAYEIVMTHVAVPLSSNDRLNNQSQCVQVLTTRTFGTRAL